MILDELVLHNFGVYRGRQTLELTPSAGKPIVLIGGLNGGGKTTLLDAVQLALFGKLAPCSTRGSLPYESYLRGTIHRGVPDSEGAGVELSLRHRIEGVEHEVRIRRSWRSTGKGFRERIEVERDGELDPLLSERWLESVDQFVPIGIAPLVFFDGEKIESLADPETSAEALSAGVHGLLGLDVVDRLAKDLVVYERRERTRLTAEADRGAIEASEKALQQLAEERERLVMDRAECQNAVDRARKVMAQVEAQFQREGGDLLDKRKVLESQREERVRQVADAEAALRDLVGGIAPLLVVSRAVDAAGRRADSEARAAESLRTDAVLEARDAEILESLRHESIGSKVLARLGALLEEDRRKRRSDTTTEVELALPENVKHELDRLSRGALAETKKSLKRARKRAAAAQAKLDQIDRSLASVPAKDAVADLLASRARARDELRATEDRLSIAKRELDRVRRAREQEQTTYERLLAQAAKEAFEQEDIHRAIEHGGRVRSTLDQFRGALVERSSRRIAGYVLEGLRHLLRKDRLVSDLEIDPSCFGLVLRGPDANELTADSLSAGERQLLAVALLWGLARAAGRPLPAIVDTPLGRLDSSHRSHLVERYYPSASHQVLLLSTDEEVNQTYWKKLRPHVSRTYTLKHDDEVGATRVEEGYFW